LIDNRLTDEVSLTRRSRFPPPGRFFFIFPLYLQSVPVHSANIVKACRRELTSTLLYLIGSESSCDLGSETYKRNLTNYIFNYKNNILNLVGRFIGNFFGNRLVSGGSCRFKISSFGEHAETT
jgi:hypothetical protein